MKKFFSFLGLLCGALPVWAALPYAYVANDDPTQINGSVSVVNYLTKQVVTSICPGRNPIDLAVSPDSKYVYVLGEQSGQPLTVISTETNSVSARVPLGLGPVDYAIRLAVTPDGKSIWILANSGRLLVVDAVRLRVAQNVILMASPGFAFGAKIVFSPDGKLAYVAAIHYIDRFGDIAQEVLVVCGITKQVLAKLPGDGTGDESPGIALSPDGNRLYVVNRSRFPDFSGGSVWVYSTITRKLVDVIPLKSPTDAIVTPDGKDVWVGYEFNGTESSKVAVVDIATNNVVRTLEVAIRSDVVKTAFTPDGKYLWIPAGFNSGGNTVFAFPTSSANIAYSVVVGNGPAAIAFPH